MKTKLLEKGTSLWQKLTSGSTNRQILGAFITVGIGSSLAKIVSVAKELVVAWKFGTSDSLDVFLISLMVPAFVINVMTSSFNSALVPTYIRVLEQQGKKAAQKLFSSTTVWSSGVLLLLTLVMLAAAPLFMPKIAAGFSVEKINLTYKLIWALSPFIVLCGILSVWSAVLNAGERFALPAIAHSITPVLTILLLLVLHDWGIFSLVIGLIAGSVLQIAVVGTALHKQGISLQPKWYGFDQNVRQVASQYTPMIAGSFLMCSCSIVDQSMAAMLPPGSVAALSYGNRVIALPISLTTTALSTAVIPYFSKMVARQDWQCVRNTLNRYLWLIIFATIPLTLFFAVFSEWIIRILFERGSFTASDTHLVAQIQTCLALQIPFYIANILIVRLISSMELNKILMWVSGLNLIINISLNYLLMQWMGVKGIALSTSFVYMFCFSFMLIAAEINLRKYSQRSPVATASQIDK